MINLSFFNHVSGMWSEIFYGLLIAGLFCSLTSCLADKPVSTSELAVQGAYTASLTQKGEFALVGSIRHGGSLWSLKALKKRERLFNWNHRSGNYTAFRATALSRDGRFGLTADDYQLVVWDVTTGESLGFWNTEGKILSVCLSDEGPFALIGLDNYEALYIDVRQGIIVKRLYHDSAVLSVDITGDGGLGISGSSNGLAYVWALRQGKEIRKWEHDQRVKLVALSRDGNKGFTYGQGNVGNIWDIRKNKTLFKIERNNVIITAARFDVKAKHFFVGDSMGTTQLWDITKGKLIKKWRAPKKNFWKPEGVIIHDVSYGKKKGTYFSVASNGLLYHWK